jgi:hypothetical protein
LNNMFVQIVSEAIFKIDRKEKYVINGLLGFLASLMLLLGRKFRKLLKKKI